MAPIGCSPQAGQDGQSRSACASSIPRSARPGQPDLPFQMRQFAPDDPRRDPRLRPVPRRLRGWPVWRHGGRCTRPVWSRFRLQIGQHRGIRLACARPGRPSNPASPGTRSGPNHTGRPTGLTAARACSFRSDASLAGAQIAAQVAVGSDHGHTAGWPSMRTPIERSSAASGAGSTVPTARMATGVSASRRAAASGSICCSAHRADSATGRALPASARYPRFSRLG